MPTTPEPTAPSEPTAEKPATPAPAAPTTPASSLTCSTGGFDYMTYNPDPQAGAGPAGDQTQQLVNYLEFGQITNCSG